MKNFFQLDLKGKTIAPYFFGAWAVIAVIVTIMILSTIGRIANAPQTPADTFLNMIWSVLLLGVECVVLFFFVKYTIGGLTLGEDKFTADYDFKKYLSLCLQGVLLCVVTMGIYAPWFYARLMRFFAVGTSFRDNKLMFRSDGMMLFVYAALLLMLPCLLFIFLFVFATVVEAWTFAYLLLIVFFCCVAIYYALMARWMMNFDYGSKRIMSTLKGWNFGWFLIGQMLLSCITVGLYYPMAIMRVWRYYVSRVVLGEELVEDHFGFEMDAWRNYLTILGQMLLCLITLGIYTPWAYARVAKLLLEQTYVEVVEQPYEPMPEDYK